MSYCHIRFDLMHVTEPGPALRHLGQSFPFQQTISTQATSYLCAVRHATQRSAPGANTRAPTLPPHVITDWEYGGIEYGGLPVAARSAGAHHISAPGNCPGLTIPPELRGLVVKPSQAKLQSTSMGSCRVRSGKR
jgi:hypothetical protein